MESTDLVSLSEWLLAQCHRDDGVGSLARRWVEEAVAQPKADCDLWLATLSKETNWQSLTAQTNAEYSTCVRLLKAGKTSATFPRLFGSRRYREALDKSFVTHRSERSISPFAYLRRKHFALRAAIKGRKLVYLDTNHWVNLRHVLLDSPQATPVYREILEALNSLCLRGCIVCPVSFPLFVELMKQSDENTRLLMARLMDCFSGGICAQAPVELERLEIRQMVLRGLLGDEAPDLREWIWTKVGYLGGIRLPVSKSFSDEDSAFIQKVAIDGMWQLPLEHFAELDPSTMPPSDLPGIADATNADAAWCRSAKLSFDKVLEQEKAYLLHLLKDDMVQIAKEVCMVQIAKEVWDEFPNHHDVSSKRKLPTTGAAPWVLPSVQVLAGANAACIVNKGKKFKPNDLVDFRHAALAVPYCDALFCDNPMAHLLRSKPLELGKAYDTEILGNSDEILRYLNVLV